MTRIQLEDLLGRAFHTFYQAFIPVFVGGLANVAHVYGQSGAAGVKSAVVALGVAAVAAGLSALKTWVIVTA